jgi:hypothetical protein
MRNLSLVLIALLVVGCALGYVHGGDDFYKQSVMKDYITTYYQEHEKLKPDFDKIIGFFSNYKIRNMLKKKGTIEGWKRSLWISHIADISIKKKLVDSSIEFPEPNIVTYQVIIVYPESHIKRKYNVEMFYVVLKNGKINRLETEIEEEVDGGWGA